MPPLALQKGPGSVRRLLLVGVGVLTCGLFGLAFVVDRFGQREFAAGHSASRKRQRCGG